MSEVLVRAEADGADVAPNLPAGEATEGDGRPVGPTPDTAHGGRLPPVSPMSRFTQRGFDLVASSSALIVLLPVMAVVAALVKLTSPGPVFYRSPRIAQDGGEFGAVKYRSMRQNADKLLQHLLATDPAARAEYDQYFKLADDPRITPIGQFLRRSSVDELPQLWNVLRGDMSIVGPRPKLLSESAVWGRDLDTVLRVKPGLTGLWQVSGRSRLTMEERIQLDVRYATERTVRGDLRICARTLVQMWRPAKHGAC
ncbi:MAG: sugar transferase [Acidimicrobiales bacterium]